MSTAVAREAASKPSRSFTVEAIVDEPSGPYNRYGIDPRGRGLRLTEVVAEQPRAAADVAYLPSTAGADVAPLRALVLSRIPLPPGCVVEARPVAMTEGAEEIVLLVPVVDPALAGLQHPAELPSEQLYQLQEQVRQLAAALRTCIWLDADVAIERIRRQIEAATRAELAAQSASGGRRVLPIWRTGDRDTPRTVGREAEAHTIAEYAVPRLPLRFQEYIAQMLLPDERILLFIHRPAFRARGGLSLLGGKRFREGILVVTDRQLLFMEDTLPPGITMVHWGYIATIGALERLQGASTAGGQKIARLIVTFAGAEGEEGLAFDFPPSFLPALQEAAGLLSAFIVHGPSQALRRIYAPPGQEHTVAPAWARESLCDKPVAWAEAARTMRGEGGRVAISPTQLVVCPEDGSPARVDLAAITSLRLTLSLLGCRFEAIAGQHVAPAKLGLRFQYPAADGFAGFVAALRSLLGNTSYQPSAISLRPPPTADG